MWCAPQGQGYPNQCSPCLPQGQFNCSAQLSGCPAVAGSYGGPPQCAGCGYPPSCCGALPANGCASCCQGYQGGKGCDGKGASPDEPRYSGWTSWQWANWVQTQCGLNWCQNKRYEADVVVEWMCKNWGVEALRSGSGVIDVGGDPGFVAVALLKRGIPTTVVDPTWGLTGKSDQWTSAELRSPANPPLCSFNENFDEWFCERNGQIVANASAIICLYGDEATAPSIQVAAATGRPCALIPCNECVRFFPPQNQTYDAYVQACVDSGNQQGGRFELIQLHGAPFSRALVAQPPRPEWGESLALNAGSNLNVPVDVLNEMGILHQVLWKMEMNARKRRRSSERLVQQAPLRDGRGADEDEWARRSPVRDGGVPPGAALAARSKRRHENGSSRSRTGGRAEGPLVDQATY